MTLKFIPIIKLIGTYFSGNILLEVESSEEGSPLVLRVKLFNKSLRELVNEFKPPVEAPKQFKLTNVVSNVCVGKQIT